MSCWCMYICHFKTVYKVKVRKILNHKYVEKRKIKWLYGTCLVIVYHQFYLTWKPESLCCTDDKFHTNNSNTVHKILYLTRAEFTISRVKIQLSTVLLMIVDTRLKKVHNKWDEKQNAMRSLKIPQILIKTLIYCHFGQRFLFMMVRREQISCYFKWIVLICRQT